MKEYIALSIISLLSVISCIYVCLNLLLNGYMPCKSKNNNQYKYSLMVIIDIIFWICITDGLIGLRSLLLNGYLPCKPTNNDQYKYSLMIIIDIIFWICITDGLIGLKNLLVVTPQIFVKGQVWFYDGSDGIMCDILAIIDIFYRIQNSLWHIILACNFLYLLRLKSLQKLPKNQYYGCIVILVR